MFENLSLIQSSLALGITGVMGYALKDIPSYAFHLFMQKFSVKIEVNSESYDAFNGTIKWCLNIFPELKNHVLMNGYEILSIDISNGLYYFFPNKFTFVSMYKSRLDNQQHEIKHNILITILGRDRFKFLQDYKECIRKAVPDLKYNTKIIIEKGNFYTSQVIFKKSFDDVYFKQKQELINLLNNFMKSDNIYKNHGLVKSLGILLYGPPGTGKTTIAKAIAAYLDWKIVFIKQGVNSLPIYTNAVILFEDIDTLITVNRNSEENITNKDNAFKITLHEALNYLDGCLTPNNTVMIATTNYIERLDPALIRDGRFDYKFKIDYMTKEIAKEMCDNFKMKYDILEEIDFPVSPAIVQNKILNEVLKKKYE